MREGLQKVVPVDDTIVAISTPFGRSGIGVVRISGKQTESIAAQFFKTEIPLIHRRATVGFWIDETGHAIDEVVTTIFRSPHSYTGEDTIEVCGHGNPFSLGRIVETIRASGARIATPGEFTLRAVLNGKIDLIQAEAVRSFIDAQTEEQARIAFLQMGGSLSKRIFPAKERLIDIIAQLEAGIDFADDEVPLPDGGALAERICEVRDELVELRKSYSYGRLLSVGLRLAIVGKPNVGKSSLFNQFVGANRSIVTDVPGTTRDVVSEVVSLDGVPLRFFDTAGLRETEELVEKIGVERTEETLSEADLVLIVLDGAAGVDERDRTILLHVENKSHITVINKCDLVQVSVNNFPGESEAIRISAKTGEGLDNLKGAIRAFFGRGLLEGSNSIMTSARQFENISSAVLALDKGSTSIAHATPHEMVLLDVYEALSNLNDLTGEVITEDILGRIFSTFCVGK